MRKLRILAAAAVMAVPVLAAAPAHACMGEVCEAINVVCSKVTKGHPCVK